MSGPIDESTEIKEHDRKRLYRQRAKVLAYMLPREDWRSLAEINAALGEPEGSISARLRDFRKAEYGSYYVPARRRVAEKGTWEYQVIVGDGEPKPKRRSRAEILRSEKRLYLLCCELLQTIARLRNEI